MKPELTWLASSSASFLHVAELLRRGETINDPALAQAAAEPLALLTADLETSGMDVRRFWRHVVPLAAGIENEKELVEVVIRKIGGGGGPEDSSRVSGRIRDLKLAMRTAKPNLTDELTQRGGPIREHWEARGPGLLRYFGFLTSEDLLTETATVILVLPCRGGGLRAHLPYNSVRLEAMLYDGEPKLPEVVRLAWGLAQLNLDLPIYSDLISQDRLPTIAGLAVLPPILASAEYVELTQFNEANVKLACETWRFPQGVGLDLAGTALTWWNTYQQSKPPWPVALQALDRMVPEF
ncbi:hypothetical protein LOC68_27810 [Blastopirellula sp. JC732]|uniref:Uncharacterized protein n=1 Tax=Blastopirellula sediminis TaxID=2894196 RepID=A0A9X1SJC2_9BACT|nr:hypothetical protein [Blastopirellula sediminis]MCC9604484.1 hypothetical protein [Blastopirellula sediminis]MCC9632217.1 hypothetical protein [Blastopirellula sediminis]